MERGTRKDSYSAYLRNRERWEEKGYAMTPELSREGFEIAFEKSRRAGRKNIARQIASEERAMSFQGARNIIKQITADIEKKATEKKISVEEYMKAEGVPEIPKIKELIGTDYGGYEVEWTLRNKKTGEIMRGVRIATAREGLYRHLKELGFAEAAYGY